jgi:hypothetical protein
MDVRGLRAAARRVMNRPVMADRFTLNFANLNTSFCVLLAVHDILYKSCTASDQQTHKCARL